MASQGGNAWSSKWMFYLVAVGAAVGLGSIWRFPYLAGTSGGGIFVLVFVLACVLIATPLLVAEFTIGRRARRSAPESAAIVARLSERSPAWGVIGWLGTTAVVLIMSYGTVIAGWVLAYIWKCAAGDIVGLARPAVAAQFRALLADPLQMALWHLLFLALLAGISARGIHHGIEAANKVRAPALLILLLILVTYSLSTGDVARGLTFALAPDFSKLSGAVVLAAIGQAFFATGVGMAMMLAYGAYIPREVSLVRSALVISASIVLVSLLATLIIFPMVFHYGMNPAQGPELVFDVLPAIFAEMPAGRLIGTLFFLMLGFAALTPCLAALEPLVAWLEEKLGLPRVMAVAATVVGIWLLGLLSVLAFNHGAHWRPFAWVAPLADMNFFVAIDFLSSNVLLPVGAFICSVFVGWRVSPTIVTDEWSSESQRVHRLIRTLLRYVCPIAILAVLIFAFR